MAEQNLREYKRVVQAWREGDLRYLLAARPTQVAAYEWVHAHWGGQPLVILCHRRWGKTTMVLVTLLELCYRFKGIDVALICKTRDQAQQVARQVMTKLAARAPEALRPVRVKNEYAWHVRHTASGLYVFGAEDEHMETLRGRTLAAAAVDEAASVGLGGDDMAQGARRGQRIGLREKCRSILLPALRDSRGQLILLSTPSRVPGHDFEAMYREAEAAGLSWRIRLSENTDPLGFTQEDAIRDCGGANDTYLREYECEFAYDPTQLAVPEVLAIPREQLVREVAVDLASDHYTSLDVGGRDLHALLFASYDHTRDSLHVQAEWAGRGVHSADLAHRVLETERSLWQRQGRITRIADAQPLAQADLARAGAPFNATKRDAKLQHLDALRQAIKQGRLTISPECPLLYQTLAQARFNPQHTGYARDAITGHADLLDSLTYLYRAVIRHRPPQGALYRDPWAAEVEATFGKRSGVRSTDMLKALFE